MRKDSVKMQGLYKAVPRIYFNRGTPPPFSPLPLTAFPFPLPLPFLGAHPLNPDRGLAL